MQCRHQVDRAALCSRADAEIDPIRFDSIPACALRGLKKEREQIRPRSGLEYDGIQQGLSCAGRIAARRVERCYQLFEPTPRMYLP